MKVGLIRVITLQDKKQIDKQGTLIQSYYSGIEVVSRCIQNQPEGIYNQETEKIAIPKIIEMGKRMQAEDFQALIVSCAADPGVKELRKILHIPVIGAGSACASLSLCFGDKVGVLGIIEETPAIMKAILGNHLVAETKPEKVETTLDLMGEEGKRRAIDAAIGLKRKKVDVIALACTGYSTLQVAHAIQKVTQLPVVDPILAAGLAIWYMKQGEELC